MNDTNEVASTVNTGVAAPDEKKPGRFVIGVGDSDKTVLKNATIENSTIGHIGEQIDVKDGGKVMTAEAVAAEAALKKAKSDDIKTKVGNVAKDIFIPGRRAFNSVTNAMDKAAGVSKPQSQSRYDEAINGLLNGGGSAKSNDTEMSK